MNATARLTSVDMTWGMEGKVHAEVTATLSWDPESYPYIADVLRTLPVKEIPVTIEDPEEPGELHSRTIADQIVKKLMGAGLVPDNCKRIAIDIGVDRMPHIYYEVALLK